MHPLYALGFCWLVALIWITRGLYRLPPRSPAGQGLQVPASLRLADVAGGDSPEGDLPDQPSGYLSDGTELPHAPTDTTRRSSLMLTRFPSRTETANTGGAHAAGRKTADSGLKAACRTNDQSIDCGALNDRPMEILKLAGRGLLGPARHGSDAP